MTRTRAKVEHPHPGAEPCGPEDALGQGVEQRRLAVEAALLGVAVLEDILLRHESTSTETGSKFCTASGQRVTGGGVTAPPRVTDLSVVGSRALVVENLVQGVDDGDQLGRRPAGSGCRGAMPTAARRTSRRRASP